MNRRAVVVLVSAPLLTACSPSRIELDGRDSGRAVPAAVGQQIQVTLQTIGPGNYGDPQISASTVRFLDMTYSKQPNPGGPIQFYRFEATRVGRADISIPHEGGFPVPREPFMLTVAVN